MYTKNMEMRGIEPRAFHMQSERSTTELHPRWRLMIKYTPYSKSTAVNQTFHGWNKEHIIQSNLKDF